MPGFDGTGPRGMGPMTGGGRGFCNPYSPFYGAGFGWPTWGGRGGGFGRGMGMGRGRGIGRGMWGPYAYGPRLPYTPYGVGTPYAPYPAMSYGPYPYNWW